MLQEFLEIEELKSIHEEKLRLMEREMALSTPLLTELEYIPMLYKWYCELSGCCEEAGVQNTDQKGQFLFVILFFYSPIALVGGRIVSGVRRISGNQIQPIQRRSIQKPQHSTGRNGSRTERRKHTQSGRLRQFLSKRKFL